MEQISAAILGWVASYLQSKTGKELSKPLKYAISLTACVGIALVLQLWGYFIGSQPIDLTTFLADIGTAFAVSQTYYNMYLNYL